MSDLDPRLVAIRDQAMRMGLLVQCSGARDAYTVELSLGPLDLYCYVAGDQVRFSPVLSPFRGQDLRGTLQSAYAALGVALDLVEESGLGRIETPAQDSDA